MSQSNQLTIKADIMSHNNPILFLLFFQAKVLQITMVTGILLLQLLIVFNYSTLQNVVCVRSHVTSLDNIFSIRVGSGQLTVIYAPFFRSVEEHNVVTLWKSKQNPHRTKDKGFSFQEVIKHPYRDTHRAQQEGQQVLF